MKFLFLIGLMFTLNSYSQSFDKYDTKEIVRAGAKVCLRNEFDKYDTKEFVKAEAKVILANDNLAKYDIKEIFKENPSLITVVITKFDKYDTKEFVVAGAKVILNNNFDKYDIKDILN